MRKFKHFFLQNWPFIPILLGLYLLWSVDIRIAAGIALIVTFTVIFFMLPNIDPEALD